MTAPVASNGSPIPPTVARYLAAVASRAPSVHNTQPWRYNYTEDGAIELHADFARQLRVTDPTGRELHVSCGAALFGLRLGISNLGYRPAIAVRPDAADPSLLARLRYGDPTPPSRADQSLLHAMALRNTHRGAFTAEPVPTTLLPALQRICESERTQLVCVQDPADQQRLAELVATAHGSHHRTPSRAPRVDPASAQSTPRRSTRNRLSLDAGDCDDTGRFSVDGDEHRGLALCR